MKYNLKKLQNTICIIAREIKRICEKNNIDYVMYAGTVLGAVRHNGFIPWDDDMDFAMTRKNYDKFIECCKTDLSKEFFLLEWKHDPSYGNFFLKVMLRDTEAVSKGNSTALYPKGIYVGIFPLDKTPENSLLRKRQKIITYILLKLIFQKENYNFEGIFTGWKKVANNTLHVFARPINRNNLIEQCEREMRRYNEKDTKTYSNVCGFYGYEKETYPNEWLEKTVSMKFEDDMYKSFSNSNAYLEQLYGNYMQLPPVEERRTHSFIKVDFGPY